MTELAEQLNTSSYVVAGVVTCRRGGESERERVSENVRERECV